MARRRKTETVAAEPASEEVVDRRASLRAFAEVADKFSVFKPASSVLRKVSAVPTIFPQYDWKTRVGGHPIERVTMVHGPSNHGKTLFAHGLGLSFLKRAHFYALVDVEFTTPITWVQGLMGEYAQSSQFLASRPRTYEEAVDGVRDVCDRLVDLRAKGTIHKDTGCLFVIDSIRKLVPKNILAKIQKFGSDEEKGSVDGYGGRAAQYRAALNAAWCDELVPLMYHSQCAIMFIARETEEAAIPGQTRVPSIKVGGGKAIFYDSSLAMRISRESFVYPSEKKDQDEGAKPDIIGERIAVNIEKTKIGGKDGRTSKAYFHLSNGKVTPEGFDRARDVLELATQLGIVTTAGSWITYERKRWQGKLLAVKALSDPKQVEVLDAMEAACRTRFDLEDTQEPEEEEAE